MAGAVEIALHPAIHKAGLVAGFFKSGANPLMNPFSVCPIFDFGDGFFLRIQDRLVESLQFGARGPSYDRPGHVGEISVGGRTGKYVENNAAVSGQRTTAFIMRIAGLFPSGNDGMLSHAITLHQRHIDEFFHALRRQRHTLVPELIVVDRRLA